MICKKCGNDIPETAKFCPVCGDKVSVPEVAVQETVASEVTAPEVAESEPAVPEVAASESEDKTENIQEYFDPDKTANIEAPVNTEMMDNVQNQSSPVAPQNVEPEVNVQSVPNPVPTPAPNPNYYQQPQYQAPVEKPQKKGFFAKFKWPLIIGVPVLVIAALVAIFFDFAGNQFRKLTMSPEKYLAYVVTDNGKDVIDSALTIYDDYCIKGYSGDDVKSTMGFSVALGPEGIDLLTAAGIDEDDISWLKKISATYSANIKGKVAEVSGTVSANDEKLVSMSATTDFQKMNISIPEILKKSIYVDLEDEVDSDEFFEALDTAKKVQEAYPDKAKLNTLANKYLSIAAGALDSVKKSNKELSAKGVKAKTICLTTNVDDYLFAGVASAVCKEFIRDDELKKVLKDAYDAINTEGSFSYFSDFEEVYAEWVEEAEEIIDDADAMLANKDSSDSDGYKLKVYVDAKGKIAGFDFADDYLELSYKHPVKNGKFGLSVKYEDRWESFTVEGSGSESDSQISGEFSVTIEDEDILSLDVRKADKSLWKKGKGEFNAALEVEATDELAQDMYYDLDVPTSMAKSILDTPIILGGKINPYDFALTMSFGEGSDKYFDVSASVKCEKATKVSMPSAKGAIEISEDTDEDDMIDELTDAFDASSVLKSLNKIKAPDEIIEAVEEVVEAIEDGDFEDLLRYGF